MISEKTLGELNVLNLEEGDFEAVQYFPADGATKEIIDVCTDEGTNNGRQNNQINIHGALACQIPRSGHNNLAGERNKGALNTHEKNNTPITEHIDENKHGNGSCVDEIEYEVYRRKYK